MTSFRRPLNASLGCAALLLVAALAAGCRREAIQVYRVPKEAAPADQPAAAMDNSGAGPSMAWTVPDGWQQRDAEQMRFASFSVPGDDGQDADVGIIPLPGVADKEGQIVNMWRDQVKLPPADESDLAKQAQPVKIGARDGRLYDIIGTAPLVDGKYPGRILVAMFTEGDVSWFFKMAGPASLVERQKPAFLQFLKSVSLVNAEMPAVRAARQFTANAKEIPQAAPAAPLPDWRPPPGWQALPTPPMLQAQFLVAGDAGAKAEVNISVMGGSGGGALANINRWRGQLGLEPVDDAGLGQLASPLDVAGASALAVDLSGTDKRSGQPARLVGVIVAQSSQTWFYKLMGAASVVGREKAAFLEFVKTVRYPDAS